MGIHKSKIEIKKTYKKGNFFVPEDTLILIKILEKSSTVVELKSQTILENGTEVLELKIYIKGKTI